MKLTLTIGIDAKGKPEIIAGPNGDPEGQIEAIREMTNNGGKIGKTKYSEAIVLHTVKGVLKSRKF